MISNGKIVDDRVVEKIKAFIFNELPFSPVRFFSLFDLRY